MLTTATAFNLERKSAWADHVQMHDGVPLPSWIDCSLTELCNRICPFCPRADPAFYPNQPLHMSLSLARKIADDLGELKYEGAVVLCGFGEPLLHPEIVDFVAQLGRHRLHVEIVTNGDKLKPYLIEALVAAGTKYFVVSMYDGPEQRSRFEAMFAEAGCDAYGLRDRWYGEDQDFGVKLTNRAGTIDVGHQPSVDQHSPCYYLGYSLAVDWNGDVLLCVQDWAKRVRFGSLATQSLMEVWTSKAMHKRRMQLLRGRKGLSPCAGCNATGTLHGEAHVAAWRGESA